MTIPSQYKVMWLKVKQSDGPQFLSSAKVFVINTAVILQLIKGFQSPGKIGQRRNICIFEEKYRGQGQALPCSLVTLAYDYS